MNYGSGGNPPLTRAFRNNDLTSDDTNAIDQVAALIMATFPGRKSTPEETQGEVRESFEPGHVSLVARGEDDIFGRIGAIPTYDFAWELHPW